MNRKASLIILLIFVFSFGLVFSQSVVAQDPTEIEYVDYRFNCLDEACRGVDSEGVPKYQTDYNCVQKRIFEPGVDCCELKCTGESGEGKVEELEVLFEIFGRQYGISGADKIPFLINMAISSVLAAISIYAVLYGFYIGAFVRARTTDEAEIEKANKTLVYLIAGFVLAWSFVFIIQIIASLLGWGSLTDLTVIDDTGGTVITIN